MTRVRNADEFLLQFRRICSEYTKYVSPRLAEVRRIYAATTGGELPSDDQNLEAHIRTGIVNALLSALNWRLDRSLEEDLANLIPEAPIRSDERGKIRFLDYLGLETDTNNPLLIVETKRPRSALPEALRPTETPAEVVSVGLAGAPLKGEWNKWLGDLTDYVRSVYSRTKRAPRRAVLTNGEWLILFLDPCDAFLENGKRDPNRIVVFEDRNDIERRFAKLFEYLEHQHVVGEIRPLTPGELPFFLTAESIDCAMHGLHLVYLEQPGVYLVRPVVRVAPVVLLRSRYGAWVRIVVPPRDYELPHQQEDLAKHLAEVQQAAGHLLSDVSSRLGRSLNLLSLSRHYEDENGFAAIPGVRQGGGDKYFLAIGSRTHYLQSEPSVPNCPFHDWVSCNRAGVPSNPGPVSIRSISPRSFFVSPESHHCAHRDVSSAKASPISASNRAQCGSRSGEDGQAFCEIWKFEGHLCCRACAFEEVCTNTTVFRLPCKRAEEATAPG